MAEATLKVTGMHCPKCDARVEKAVSAVAGVTAVKADHESDTVVVTFEGENAVLDAVREAITAQDFTVEA